MWIYCLSGGILPGTYLPQWALADNGTPPRQTPRKHIPGCLLWRSVWYLLPSAWAFSPFQSRPSLPSVCQGTQCQTASRRQTAHPPSHIIRHICRYFFFYQFLYLFTDDFLIITYGYVQSHHLQFISHENSFPTGSSFYFLYRQNFSAISREGTKLYLKGNEIFSFSIKIQKQV